MKGTFRILFVDEVDSTNEYLKRVPFEDALFVVADRQTKGKGRRGKNWISERGKGLYLSGMFSLPPLPYRSLAGLSFAVATISVIRRYVDKAYLKWPNDVYVNGKKLCGILVEVLRDRLIVGIGVNVSYGRDELSHLDVPATSLLAEGVKVDRRVLAEELAERLVLYKRKLCTGNFCVSEFEKFCPMIGKTVKIIDGKKSPLARVLGIDREGALIVEFDDEEGRRVGRIFSADVSVRIL